MRRNQNKDVFTFSINTLAQIFRNIRDNITSEKYRTLKKSNQKIGQLLSVKENYRILAYGGF